MRRPWPRPSCIECDSATRVRLVTGAVAYPHLPKLAAKDFWMCRCGAKVGCHPGTQQPLGRPCGPETALARERAHRAFDGLWRAAVRLQGRSKGDARAAAYRWLRGQLGIAPQDCHIGMMDAATARRVIDICRPYLSALRKTSAAIHQVQVSTGRSARAPVGHGAGIQGRSL